MMIECPHCHMETEHKVIDHINIDRNPELRAKVQDLSVFRVKCPNCGETVLVVHPCLYHDMANQFMVWLWTEDGQVPKAEFDPLAGYTLRVTDSLNTFREKINILERGLDDVERKDTRQHVCAPFNIMYFRTALSGRFASSSPEGQAFIGTENFSYSRQKLPLSGELAKPSGFD